MSEREQSAAYRPAEAPLPPAHEDLEQPVRERTAGLLAANSSLRGEIERPCRSEQELRQPLAAILTNTEAGLGLITAHQTVDRTELLEILSDVAASAQRAGEILGRLRLPQSEATPGPRPADGPGNEGAQPALAASRPGPSKVLPPYFAVVDNDEAVGKALKRLLKALPFEVRVFRSGLEFVSAVISCAPEAAILDMEMPDLHGLEIQDRLLAESQSFPIIFTTAVDDEAARRRALERGAAGFLSKPFNREAILGLLAAACMQVAKDPVGLGLRLQRDPAEGILAAPDRHPTNFELTELSTCPFCGAYPRMDQTARTDPRGRESCAARVVCPCCGAEVLADPYQVFTTSAGAAHSALRRWNRRAPGS